MVGDKVGAKDNFLVGATEVAEDGKSDGFLGCEAGDILVEGICDDADLTLRSKFRISLEKVAGKLGASNDAINELSLFSFRIHMEYFLSFENLQTEPLSQSELLVQ